MGLGAQPSLPSAEAGTSPQAGRDDLNSHPQGRPPVQAKSTAPAKYQDDAGHQWSGIGKRPNWFKTALTSGKTAADLLIDKPPAA
jgi:DNA-binding protein H-NS